MSVIKQLASDAYDELIKSSGDVAIDPAFWDQLLEFIRELVSILNDCGLFARKPTEELVSVCRQPTRLQEWRMAWRLRRITPAEVYREHGEQILSAVKSVGSGMTTEKLEAAFAELECDPC